MPHCQYPGIAPSLFSCRIFAVGAILSDSRYGHFGRPRPARPGYRVAARYVPTLLTTPGAHRVTPHSMRGPVKCRLRVPAFVGIPGFRIAVRNDMNGIFLDTPSQCGMTPTKKPLQLARVAGVCHIDSVIDYLFRAWATSTAQATVQPTMGLLPIPRKPIISTWAGTDEEPAN